MRKASHTSWWSVNMYLTHPTCSSRNSLTAFCLKVSSSFLQHFSALGCCFQTLSHSLRLWWHDWTTQIILNHSQYSQTKMLHHVLTWKHDVISVTDDVIAHKMLIILMGTFKKYIKASLKYYIYKWKKHWKHCKMVF